MRTLTFFAIAVVIAALGVKVKTAFLSGSPNAVGSTTKEVATADTMLPHEVHLNYQGMKELPVHEVKEPF
jgi:hypothetical protein